MQEIRHGLERKIDVSLYAKKEFTSMQMRIVKEALIYGIDVEEMVSMRYDTDQMYQLLMAGQKRITRLERLYNPKLSARKMKSIIEDENSIPGRIKRAELQEKILGLYLEKKQENKRNKNMLKRKTA
jgi:hypothetical protein